MTHSATTRGLQELAQLRNRVTRDYGFSRMKWPDFEYINVRLMEIEERLIEMATNDPKRLNEESKQDAVAI